MHDVSERKRANIEGSLFSTGSQLVSFLFPFSGHPTWEARMDPKNRRFLIYASQQTNQ
jgi:hypothetical protein